MTDINEEAIKCIVASVVAGYQDSIRKSQCFGENWSDEPKSACLSVGSDNVEILVEASGRHVHLSETDIERLFGKGYRLTPKKKLSQIGQFACEERVTLIGPKNIYRNVAVLGPARKNTQVELSISDAKFLGVDAPVNMSGNLKGAGDIIIAAGKEAIAAKSCAIVAQNHIHMTPDQARTWGFKDNQTVSVSMKTARPITFDNVVIRVSETAGLAMHIDFDEANACLFETGDTGIINCTDKGLRLVKSSIDSGMKAEAGIDKKFVTEDDILKFIRKNGTKDLVLKRGTVLSALAKDLISKKKISVNFL